MPSLSDLSDTAALAEAKRLSLVIMARRDKLDTWIGVPSSSPAPKPDENSGFTIGMLAMFRYARGEDVPDAIVRVFIDDLLELLFCGLASPSMALPSFRRMEDRPWAHAWRAAELRLIRSAHEDTDTGTLAHLLKIPSNTLAKYLIQNGCEPDCVPAAKLDEVCEFFKNLSELPQQHIIK